MLSVPLCLALGSASVQAQEAESGTLEKRAAAYGALAHLPKTTEGAVSIRNLTVMFDEITKSNFFNRALFASNGDCGYVLKPDFLRDPAIPYSPLSPSGLPAKRNVPRKALQLTILSGQHIPRPDGKLEGDVIDPYVKVRLKVTTCSEVDINIMTACP